MTVNIDEMMLQVAEAFENPEKAVGVLEEWIPQVANEIQDLRRKVMLQETEILGLQQEVQELTI